jgi:glutamate 5-kinase
MKQRIVIKIGSNVLTRSDGTLDVTQMSALVDQIAALRELGNEIILVSSGSVASGRSELKTTRKLDSVEQRQLFSAVGQVKLLNYYYDLFRERHIHIGQVLTMKENFSTRREYLNQRSCMNVMLSNGVLPIVNENDTVSVTELMFTDNDELSGLIASMMNATTLILLSNVDGIYNGPPQAVGTRVIRRLKPDDVLTDYIQPEKSGFGRGGMVTKCRIARKVAAEGIRVYIANGRRAGILTDLLLHPDDTLHTEFVPADAPVSSVKKWIAHSAGFAKGVVHISAPAVEALCNDRKAVSLLMVGVTGVEGDFEEGDIVSIVGPDGSEIAVGRSAYGVDEARCLMGKHDVRPLVHYDYLFLHSDGDA